MANLNKQILILFIFILSNSLLPGCRGKGKFEHNEVSNSNEENSSEDSSSSESEESSIEEISEKESESEEESTREEESSSFAGIESIDEITDSTASINWSHHDSANAYEIYDVTSEETYVATVVAPTATYDLSGLNNSTLYKFRVLAKDSSGNLDSNTNDVSFTTNLAPDAPSKLEMSDPLNSSDFDDTPTIRISGVKSGDTINIFTDSDCSNQVGSDISTDSTAEVTSDSLTADDYTFYANATNENGHSSDCSTESITYTINLCPDGYIAVPENTTLGVSAFCVMQFEAKNDGEGNAISTADGSPWIEISQTDSKSECTDLGDNYNLISNPEWMAIARNIEAQDENWSNGTVGDGCLFVGNNGAEDDCSYDGENPESGTDRNEKAKHILSNGEEVWDMASNIWEWTDWTLGGELESGPTSCSTSWKEIPDVNCEELTLEDYMPSNPAEIASTSYNSDYGLGWFRGGSDGATLRSAHWNSENKAGIFSLYLKSTSTSTAGYIGFRCVFRP